MDDSVMGWREVGVVVRSFCHERTWVGHLRETDLAFTPAGPLRVVKLAMEHELLSWGWVGSVRWSRSHPDSWVMEFREGADSGDFEQG